jgi:hypothetical protein
MKMSLLLALLLLMNTTPSAAQGGTLTLQGVVTDASHALMPGVPVTVKHEGNKLPRLAVTDERGRYVLSGLRPGDYELLAALPGWARDTQTIKILAATEIDVVMRIAPYTGGGITVTPEEVLPPSGQRARNLRQEAENAAAQLWQFTLRMEDTERSERSNRRSYQALREFQLMGTDAVPALALALQDEDVQVRRNAAVVLAFFVQNFVDTRQALPVLRERLQDPDAQVRLIVRQVVETIEKSR